MSVKKLVETAIKHLYAAEVLQKLAADLSVLMEHMTDEQVEAVITVRELIVGYAQSELTVATALGHIAEQEKATQ